MSVDVVAGGLTAATVEALCAKVADAKKLAVVINAKKLPQHKNNNKLSAVDNRHNRDKKVGPSTTVMKLGSVHLQTGAAAAVNVSKGAAATNMGTGDTGHARVVYGRVCDSCCSCGVRSL